MKLPLILLSTALTLIASTIDSRGMAGENNLEPLGSGRSIELAPPATEIRLAQTSEEQSAAGQNLLYLFMGGAGANTSGFTLQRTGTSNSTNYSSTGTSQGFALGVGFRVAPDFTLEVESWNALSQSVKGVNTTPATLSRVGLGVNAKYDLPLRNEWLSPYIGGGVGISLTDLTGQNGSLSGYIPYYQAIVGVNAKPFGDIPFELFAQYRYAATVGDISGNITVVGTNAFSAPQTFPVNTSGSLGSSSIEAGLKIVWPGI
jgi:opacity protein-like surface antigen